ncbi:hypothetical protein [Candidatus Magnetobacterium casense]|uniref:Holliday junction resolvase RuvC n=1 Tax=Candidatus Magnetobacterium casense TaxID=1455061 RepID=A0ABS6RVS7_9BACT|nr:hypothetical protein [Candidatus Magnetobacterium casensis]MBV6340119.1 hypothetical protein [Candidatus Magnetobacterium casensis]
MVSLGIDPSLVATGCVRVKKGEILGQQLIKTKTTSSIREELERLRQIRDQIIFDDVSIVILEGLAMGASRTTSLVQLAGLNYLIREHFYLLNIPFVIVTPMQLKKFVTGKGNCKKELMLLETYRRYNIAFDDNNLCDAYVLARIGDAILNNNEKLDLCRKGIIDNLRKQYGNPKKR